MVEWIVSSSVLIAVIALLRSALKGKISLRLQYALWALVLLRLLAPVSFGGTAMSVENLTRRAADTEPARYVSALSEAELPRMSYQAAYNEVAEEYAGKGIQIEELPLEQYAETVDYEIMNKMNGGLSIAEIARVVWICGITLVGVWFVISNLRLMYSLKKTRTLLAGDYELPVYLSGAIDTPCLFGLFRPAIYLTGEAAADPQTMRHAVEHELTHYHHRDNVWAILRGVCLAIHWFNPLVWWAAVLSRNDAELACDESTILRLGESERAAYGRTLISLTCEKRPALLNTATTMTGSGRSIKERISLIVKKPKMALYTAAAVVLIAAAAVGCTFTGAKGEDTPLSWARSLSVEDITSAMPWDSNGDMTALTSKETGELVRLLNALEEASFTENTGLAGSTPSYGLTLETLEGEYHINESIAPAGGLEMSFGDKQWWIDSDALVAFVRGLPSEKGKSLLDDAYERALSILESIEGRKAENTISKDTAQEILYVGETQCDIEFPVKGMDWFVAVTYTRETPEDDWVLTSAVALTYALPSNADIQKVVNNILVGELSYDETWQSAGSYALTVSSADGRTDTYSCVPGTFYSLMSTPGYYVSEMYDWTVTDREAWTDDLADSDYALTMANDQYSVTVYSHERKMKIIEADGSTMYFIGTPRPEDGYASTHQYERLFLKFRQYAMVALETYELSACSVSGTETDYEVIARELSEQYARLILDRPGWYDRQAQDAKVKAANVFDAYYGEDAPNFLFGMGLYLKMDEDQTNPWQAGAGLSDPPASGEFAGYYGYGSQVGVRKSEDGRWRMDGFASGGGWVHLPIALGEATTQQLMELYFLTSGQSRDWRILSTLAERPLEEVRAQLDMLEASQKQELTAGILAFMEAYPDYHTWSADDF